MKIHLISHTHDPLRSIAAGILNIGIGRDIRTLDDITREEAETAFKDTCKSWLTSPLEYASFNFFWEDIPLFMRTELERARVGWSYCERSLRFFQADERDPVDKIDWDLFPSVKTDHERETFKAMAQMQMDWYKGAQVHGGLDTQDARNVIGSWFGTALQTSCNFRALRDTMAVRLSSQAHAGWQKAAHQIKDLVSSVDPVLGEALVDTCTIQGRCVWHSKLDRPCQNCIARGKSENNHVHKFVLKTKSGMFQCSCGNLEYEVIGLLN